MASDELPHAPGFAPENTPEAGLPQDVSAPASIEPEHDFEEDEDDSFYGLGDDTIAGIIAAVHAEDWLTVEQEIFDLDPSEIAQLLEKASRDDAREMVKHLHQILDSETYTYLGYERLKSLFTVLSPREIAGIIADLNTDDAISLLEEVDEDERREILRHVNTRSRALVEEGFTYPEDSAGRLMQRDVVAIPQFWTVGKTLDYLHALGHDLPEQLYDLFLVDPRHRVVGQIAVGQLWRATRGEKINSIAVAEPDVIPAETDQEEVAALFKRTTLTSAPVVDDAERLIGVITIDDIVSVIDEEAGEDLLRLGGVENSDLHQPAHRTAWSRFRWLFVNLLTALLAASVVGHFSHTLEKIVALAVLMPIVAGMGGNAGTQALTVAVRALATNELSASNYLRVTFKEMTVGFINGSLCAIMMGSIATLWFHDVKLGAVIAAAMMTNLFVAGLAGILIPVGLDKMNIDPAVASGVFLTTVTDIIGFSSFLGLATIFLLH